MSDWLLHHEMERQARWQCDKLAFWSESQTYTFDEFNQRVNRLARALRDSGVAQEDSIITHGLNTVDLYTVFFACSKVGAIYSTISSFQPPTNVNYICDTLEPPIVFYTSDDEIVNGSLPPIQAALDGAEFVSLDSNAPVGTDFEAFIDGYDPSDPDWSNDHSQETYQNIFWTSGTTGRPKAVVRDHQTSLCFADALVEVMPFTNKTRRLVQGDMMYVAPYLRFGLPTLRAGGTIYLIPRFDPSKIHEIVEEQGITDMILGFTRADRMYEYVKENNLDFKVPHIASTFTAKKARQLSEIAEELYHTYGSTEIGMAVATKLEPPYEDRPPLGVPRRHADVRLAPPDDRTKRSDSVPEPGDSGQAAVKGNTTMSRYLDDEVQAENVIDGWVYPGDVLRVNDDRELVFVGRTDHRIRSGGLNIFPGEIEAVLTTHPDVEDAVVVGVEDEEWGNRISTVITTGRTDTEVLEKELDEHCLSSDDLIRELRPRQYAFVRSPDELPTGAANKVDRDAVIELFF